jgi:hypothetical protein
MNSLKIVQTWAGGVAQAVRGLPSKHEALHSNSSTKRKRKKIVQIFKIVTIDI